jgi:dynein heavy chain
MKAILDSWLKVQAAWLYLEPIFGSEDIRNQIPVEGKMFEEVDGHWCDEHCFTANRSQQSDYVHFRKNIMENAILDTKALVVTDQQSMLEKLQHSEVRRRISVELYEKMK